MAWWNSSSRRLRPEPLPLERQHHLAHPPVLRHRPPLRQPETLEAIHDPGGVGGIAFPAVRPSSPAAQAGPFGIRVNCIAPETILTERNLKRIPEAQREALVEQHPVRRLGTPEDVAEAALFLAADASGWITGVILDVAGGAVMG